LPGIRGREGTSGLSHGGDRGRSVHVGKLAQVVTDDVERPSVPCSINATQTEMTGVLSELHLAEHRLDDRLAPGVVGSSGLGPKASWSAGRGESHPPAPTEVYGKAKSGAACGYTKVLGYHPILAVAGGHRRGPARPYAQGLVQYLPGGQAFRRRARRQGPALGGGRRDGHALRLGLLVERHHRRPGALRGALHHGRALRQQPCRQGHFQYRRDRLGPHRPHPRRHRPGGRGRLRRAPAHSAPHPADRAQQALFPIGATTRF
jgi:hypothetical protein